MSSIAGGMKGGGCLGDVLAHNRHLANLPVAEAEFVMSETDGPRIVRALGLIQGLGEERDPSRRFAAGYRETAMEPPQIRESRRIEPLAPFRRGPERFRCPSHIVLKQPGLGKGAPDLDLLVTVKARLAEPADEKRSRFCAHPAFKRANRLAVEISRGHGREYSRYTGEVDI
jgi:hypothetical protein